MKIRGQRKLKLIDYYIGIPLVYLLGSLRKRKDIPKEIKKVGVLLPPTIGDTILLSAPLKDLSEKNNGIEITTFVPEENKEVAELIDISNEVVPLNIFRFFESVKRIRKFSFDLFIDTSQWARINSLLTYFSNSRSKIGFDTKYQYRKIIYDSTVTHSNKVHEIYNFRKLISLAGIRSNNLPEIKIHINGDPKKISIHLKPGGYLSYLKEWPENRWVEIVKYLLVKGYNIFFTGSKKDFDSIEYFIKGIPNKTNLFNVAGEFSLYETAVHLKSSKLVISVNTGIMHLASAVGANLIALHGPTNPVRWGPINKNSITIQSTYPYAPCLNLGFEYNCKDKTGECMKTIQVHEVIKAIEVFLNTNN
jgi:heptosyltransferase I